MKTEKQVRTLDNIEIFSVYKKTTSEVLDAISIEDHLAIVAELEKKIKYLESFLEKALEEDEKN